MLRQVVAVSKPVARDARPGPDIAAEGFRRRGLGKHHAGPGYPVEAWRGSTYRATPEANSSALSPLAENQGNNRIKEQGPHFRPL